MKSKNKNNLQDFQGIVYDIIFINLNFQSSFHKMVYNSEGLIDLTLRF